MTTKLLKHFQKNVRNMTQDELLDLLGYSFMRIGELEMLFDVLVEKKVISKKDFDELVPKFEKKMDKKFKKLTKRENFMRD